MSCNKYDREYCIATGYIIHGHKRRYCTKCRAVYQKNYRQRQRVMINRYKKICEKEFNDSRV